MNISRSSLTKFYMFCLSLLLIVSFGLLSITEVNADTIEPYTFYTYFDINSDTEMTVPLPAAFSTNGSDTLRIVMHAKFDSTSAWMVAPFGSYNASRDIGLFFLVNPVTGKYSIQYGNSWSENNGKAFASSDVGIDILFRYGFQQMLISDDGSLEQSYQHTYKPSTAYSIDHLTFFRREISSGSTTRCGFRGRVYDISVLVGSNDLIYELLPCKRNSDNVYGFYNTVDGSFYTASTGSFIPGDVFVPSYPDTPDVPVSKPILDLPIAPTVDIPVLNIFSEGLVKPFVSGISQITMPIVNISILEFIICMICFPYIIHLINKFVFHKE